MLNFCYGDHFYRLAEIFVRESQRNERQPFASTSKTARVSSDCTFVVPFGANSFGIASSFSVQSMVLVLPSFLTNSTVTFPERRMPFNQSFSFFELKTNLFSLIFFSFIKIFKGFTNIVFLKQVLRNSI